MSKSNRYFWNLIFNFQFIYLWRLIQLEFTQKHFFFQNILIIVNRCGPKFSVCLFDWFLVWQLVDVSSYSWSTHEKWSCFSRFWLFATPWTIACQAPPCMGFSKQEHWSGLPFPSPVDLPDPGIKSGSPSVQADALPFEP